MRTSILIILLLICGAPLVHAQPTPHQSQALKVYVNPMEGPDMGLAEMVTAKLISRLVKHGISVVESEEDADAVLTGAGLMQGSTSEYGHTRFRLHAGMRLVDKHGSVIWADDVASGRYSQSASSSFAENVAKSLEAAVSAKSQNK